jgi:hypothetical protein
MAAELFQSREVLHPHARKKRLHSRDLKYGGLEYGRDWDEPDVRYY